MQKFPNQTKILNKTLAVFLVIVLTGVNIIFLGANFTKSMISYASGGELEMQGTSTNHKNVEFDSYFLKDDKKIHSKELDINSQSEIYLSVKVNNEGYLKNAKVKFAGIEENEELNYEISEAVNELELVESLDIDNKILYLRQIDAGIEGVINIPIHVEENQLEKIGNLSKTSKAILEGIYVDQNGEEFNISKEIKLNIRLIGNVESALSSEVVKYINDGNKVILQTKLTSGLEIEEENNLLPILETNLKIKVPTIGESLPTNIDVTANSLKATNGKEENFNSENWSYNEEENSIEINVKNSEQNGTIWTPKGQDEYLITYSYENIDIQELNIKEEIESTISVYNKEEPLVKTIENEYVLTEKIGEIVTSAYTQTNEISKGKIYANYQTDVNYKEEYISEEIINIADNNIEKIIVQYPEDEFANEEESIEANTYYKQIAISKNDFDKILGEDGYIIILNNGTEIARIDKTLSLSEDGKYIISFEERYENIELEISKPIGIGNLKIQNTKTIDNSIGYTKQIMQNMTIISSKSNLSIVKVDEETISTENTVTTNLKDTITSAKIEIDKESLSTVVPNENIEIKIELNNQIPESDLYVNPVFDVILPEEVEKIEINNASLLYGEGLNIKSAEVVEKNRIRIELEGSQAEFSSGIISNGTNILLNLNITLNKESRNKEEQIILNYENPNTINYENSIDGVGIDTTKIILSAPKELSINAQISGFNSNGNIISTSGEKTGKLEIYADSINAEMQIDLTNNDDTSYKNVKILGRIPYSGNRSITTNENLGSNLNTVLSNLITSEGITDEQITIKYSENGEETVNGSSWVEEVENISTIKSYLITINEIKPSTKLSFKYEITIPENLEHNSQTFETFAVYHTKDGEQEKVVEPEKLGLSTGKGPQLSSTTKLELGENEKVYENRVIKYKFTVTNTGNEIAENVRVKVDIPEGATYIEYREATPTVEGGYQTDISVLSKEFEAGNLNPAETKEFELMVKVNELVKVEGIEEQNIISMKSIVTADGLEKELESNIVESIVEEADFEIELSSSREEGFVLQENMEMQYRISIGNISDEIKQNIVIEDTLPEGLEYVDAYISKYNESTDQFEEIRDGIIYENGKLTINIANMAVNEYITINVELTAKKLGENIYDLELVNIASVVADGTDKYYSLESKHSISRPNISVTETSSNSTGYLNIGDKLDYIITIKNDGNIQAKNLQIVTKIPEELNCTEIYYKIGDKEVTEAGRQGEITLTINTLPSNTEMILYFRTTVKNITSETEEREISNYATITLEDGREYTTNRITHIIENLKQDPNQGHEQEARYRISGTAWIDENKNGAMDENEQKLANVTTRLISVDGIAQVVQTVTTDMNGEYVFNNVNKGKYIVIFEYDTNAYGLTEYEKEGVDSSINSKTINTEFNSNLVAATNTLEITTRSIANINLGLIIEPKFDLKLDKTISRIIVQTSKEVKTYEYDNSKLAKVDIRANELNGAIVLIEYKINVTNEGQIPGTATEIIDYLPDGLEFISDINADWYKSSDGNLYTNILEDEIINPGETKELTLTLRKTMTEENTKIVNNIAEINEAYNDRAYLDVDSIPGNNVQGEDDMSSADAIITVHTGESVLYICITLISIIILGTGIYLIKKKVLGV